MFPRIFISRAWTTFALTTALFSCVLAAQTRKPGSTGYGEVTVSTDAHHDVSLPLRNIVPVKAPVHSRQPISHPIPEDKREGALLTMRV